MISKYRHAGIVVSDMDKAMHFYCDLLGHDVIVDFVETGDYFDKLIGLKNASARVVKASAPDGSYMELIQFTTHQPVLKDTLEYNIGGLNHICFTVDDIEGLYRKLSADGVKFVSPPLASTFDPVKTCFCYDPDDSLIQFVEITDVNAIRPGLR